ncbi:MAG: glutamine-hydrolyzing carbamoyl-phosphate synthase small subunit [Pseudomonadota bacterium]
MSSRPAVLALADGAVFHGRGLGPDGVSDGEVVFNTAMSGYQEILTDPSYSRQLVTLTCPHIGNTGCNDSDRESGVPAAAGLIIRDLPLRASSWRSETDLSQYMLTEQIRGIWDIDTRHLTRLLRDGGAQNGCIGVGEDLDPEALVEKARSFPGLKGMDLARVVTTEKPYGFSEGGFDLDANAFRAAAPATFKVVAYDFGVKRNILRLLADRGCELTVVPAETPAAEALALKPDGVFLSNGPGDPEPCAYAIDAIKTFLEQKVPTFGICLGHQLLALASGAKTVKMKFGHHGANHPVAEVASGRVFITSQNHGFAVDEESLPEHLTTTHRSLFDGSLQGVRHNASPAFGFQGHPEASPGPHDIRSLFDEFIDLMKEHARA